MKKIIFFLVGLLTLSSCSKKVSAPLVTTTNQIVKKGTIFTVEATAEAISTPIELGGGITFQIAKNDLTGAVSYFDDAVTITPVSKIAKNTEHDKGAIVLNAKIEGGDIIHVAPKAGWVISDALYTNEKDLYPSRLKVTLEVDQGKSFCMNFVLDRAESPMQYKPEINANNGQPIMHPNAGYEITDCAGNKAYISEADIPLQKLYIELRLDDTRTQKKTGGVKLPVDY
jgi:hypothetical protein